MKATVEATQARKDLKALGYKLKTKYLSTLGIYAGTIENASGKVLGSSNVFTHEYIELHKDLFAYVNSHRIERDGILVSIG